MIQPGDQLIGVLERRLPSHEVRRALEEAGDELGLPEGDLLSPTCAAYALLKLNLQAEEVSRLLTWREFEKLTGALLRVSGYGVEENVNLTHPRAQIDLVARGTSLILSVDCKHYSKGHGPAMLRRFALAQLARSRLLRKKLNDRRPIASVILSTSEPEGRFVEGVAVVPVRTFRSFLTTIDSYSALFDLK